MNRESDLGGRAHACDLSIPLGHRQNQGPVQAASEYGDKNL